MEDNSILTREQILFYRRNGYLIVPDVLTSEQCDRMNQIFEQYAKDHDIKELQGN